MRLGARKARLTIVLVVVLVLERWGRCCLIKPPFDVRRYVSEPKTTRSIENEDDDENEDDCKARLLAPDLIPRSPKKSAQ